MPGYCEDLLVAISHLYYLEGLKQESSATTAPVSTSGVSLLGDRRASIAPPVSQPGGFLSVR